MGEGSSEAADKFIVSGISIKLYGGGKRGSVDRNHRGTKRWGGGKGQFSLGDI